MDRSSKKSLSVLLIMVIVLSMTISMAGCGGGTNSGLNSDTSKAVTDTTSTEKKDPVEITIWSHLVENTEVPVIKQIAEEWAAKTGNKVKVVYDTTGFQAYVQAANSSKGPDIMYGMANDTIATFDTAKLLDEVPEGMVTTDKYAQGSIDAVTINGKQVAVPLAVETVALFYNTDKVSKVPATWDELVEQAKSVGLISDLSTVYLTWPYISGKGGYTYKLNNGVYDTNDIGLGAASKEGYALINSLVNEYKFMKHDVNLAVATSTFKSGKAGFYIGGPWDITSFKEQSDLKFNIVPFPQMDGRPMRTFVGVQCAFVSSKSKNKDVAWELVEYLNENTAIPFYQKGNRIPALLTAQQDSTFKADTLMAAFAEQAKVGEALPTIPEIANIWQPYTDNMKLLLTNKITLDQMVEKMDKDIRQRNKDLNSSTSK